MADYWRVNFGHEPVKFLAISPCRSAALLLIMIFGGNAVAYEQPEYQVLEKRDGYEIRRYSPYIVAETVVDGGFKDAGSEAFRILAGYIFGDNSASEKMSMTAPVESQQADSGVTMNMTAPVTSQPTGNESGHYAYRFVMESKYSLETLPQPNDTRVRIRAVEARTVALVRYSGSWTRSNYDKHRAGLLQALEDDGIEAIGEPLFARYNSPFTPWFLRRNEVMIEIDWPGSTG